MKTTDKSKWNKRTQCSAIHCKNYHCDRPDLGFHRFPKDPDRCARWVQHLRNASLMGISSQRLNHSYRVCSAHFHASQFKRPSNVHAGLKWDAVPTIVNAPNPPPPLDLELKRKPPKTRQELPPKKRKKSNFVYLSSAGSSTADRVQQPAGSEADITSPDASVAGPSMPLTQPLPPMSLPTGLEAAGKEHALKMKIRSLRVQVCKLKTKLREVNRLKNTRKACVNKESVMKQLKKLLPAKAYAFVSTQIQMSKRKARGFRWTTQDKAFFLSLLHASPKCYRLLFKVFSMPSVRTLQKLMKSVDFKPGFNHSILATMKKAMETTKPVDKVCAIITDEISLKQAVHYNESADRIEGFEDFGRGQRTPYVANYASAFMVRGLFRKWKQLFGYCFTSGPIPHTRLQSLLLEAIRELRKAGMDCIVFICDQGSGNRSMLTRLGVTKEKPFFEVDAVRVFCLWDPPHLIKNIRNNWRRSGFTLDGDHIFWAILEELYTYDSKQDIRLCCRLTKKHVHLPPFASMRVRFATQVLSHSVAVGIKTLAQVKQLTGQAQRNYMAAAKFCENFDGIFNCFNSKQLKDSHKLKSALSDASAHFPFLEKCMEWLPRLKLASARPGAKQIPCVEGWQHNIVCLKMIWCDLRERHQVSYLLTNRLNQDCLENAYSTIRARGGNRDCPDSVQFECEYRAVATGLMFNNSEKTNCEQDLDTFLLQFSTYASQESPQVIIDTKQISAEHCYISQDSPRTTINTVKIIDEHSYARDLPVTANVGAEADQVEQPMDCSLENQFDSHQISLHSSENHGEPMDCSVVRESERSGRVVSQDQLSTSSKTVNLRIQGQNSASTKYLQEQENSDAVLESDVSILEGVLPKRVLDLLSEIRPPVSAASAFDHDGNVLVYIAGYMARKVVEKFTDSEDGPCKECKILTTDIPANTQYTFLKDKQYTDLNLGEKGLKVPSMALVELITALESNFRKKINSVIHTVGLGRKLFNSSIAMVNECRGVVCDTEKCKKSLIYMVRLFIRIRIHHILRTQNSRISQPNQKRNRKFLKLSHQ